MTTFDGFHNNALASDDEDEPLITLLRGRNDGQSPKRQVRSQKAPRGPRRTYNSIEPRNRSPEKRVLGALQAGPHAGDSHHHHQDHGQSRAHGHDSRHARLDRGSDGRNHSFPEQEQRRMILPIRPSMVPKQSFTQRIAGLVIPPQSAADAKAQLKQMISSPIVIEERNPLPAEQFDAPKSAVNAGERTVRVKYKEFHVPVTIVPSTTPGDVIRSISEKVATTIDPDSTVILESFKQLGLERPLRRYEHIRDVLNSWDSDPQNTLIVEPSSTGGCDDDLNVRNVPRQQPDNSSFYLYHSQRPGHWDKREVTLRSDGQMLIAKSSGSETSNICHLSDFDIYIPTARQMAKKIRPPKRICFAVKSQQKSNMFMSTVNFVHFFSSNDKKVAKALYTAVQEWRSWYLVNMMGKGVEQPSQALQGQRQAMAGTGVGKRVGDSTKGTQTSHKVQVSQPVPLKTSVAIANAPPVQQVQKSVPPTWQTKWRNYAPHDHREKQAPLVSSPQYPSAGNPVGDPFTNGGLLGPTYEERQNAQRAHEPRPAVTPTQKPVSSPSPIRSPSNELKRSSSQLKKPKPLIDLTPQYQEPPQHSKKGRGVTPGHIPAGGLVDIATSPEVAIPIPPTASWRRPGTSPGQEISPPRNRSQP